MIKKSLLFVVLLSLVSVAFGQADPVAEKILKESQKKFNSQADIKAQFTYTLANPNLEKAIVKKGDLTLKKNKYRINFSEEEFYCDGKNVWVYLIEEEEVTITEFDPEESLSIESIFKVYEKNSRAKYAADAGSSHKIQVFPLDEENDIWKAELWISKSTKLIQKAKLYGRNGSTYEYALSNMKTNTKVSDSVFTFDPNTEEHKDVYINNLTE